MRRVTVVYSVVCVFVAVGLATWVHAAPRIQPNDILKCQPQFGPAGAGSVFASQSWSTNRSSTLRAPTGGGTFVTAWWIATWQMQYQFNCGGGNDNSNCKICLYIQVSYFSATNHTWILAPMGFDGYYTDTGDCGATSTRTWQTSYDYPVKAGTTLQVIWNGGLYDPAIGTCNNGEEYEELSLIQYVVPADGP